MSPTPDPESWRVSLPCTRAEGAAIAEVEEPFAGFDNAPVLMTSEPDEDRPEEWQLDAYFPAKPNAALLKRLKTLAPSASDVRVKVVPILPADWVTLSQAGVEPIDEGCFHLYTSAYAAEVPAGKIAFRIEAGRAFGTGQHHTTAGCLAMIDRIASEGRRFHNALDLGTGTGVLGFALARRFGARVIASDIDPVSIEVTAENAAINGIRTGRGRGEVELAVADGMRHRRLRARAPYDFIAANILAGPLIDMARPIAQGLAPGGTLLLAGLLGTQAEAVARAYARQGCRLVARIDRSDWAILRLQKKKRG